MSFYNYLLKNSLISTMSNHIDTYPTPINLTYLWGFGSIAGIALIIQIITGVLLAMHYASEIHLAFSSVEHIMRDVKGGVALRYIHANGASMFLLVVYIHMFRGLYYGSYFQPRANLWYSGIVIFLAMMATAFMGYVLPWGQMSFWGATVITNLFSAIPYIGDSIVQLLWGGFSVDNPTLNRFFSLHYFVPFIIAAVAGLHLILLHQPGSNNPLGVNGIYDRIPFYPYFYVKDLFGFIIFIWIFSIFVIYAPNYLGHADNYIEANPLVTPAHIVPEWYFLPFYAILRSIPDKLGGVLLMVIAIIILAILPLVDTSSFRSTFFKPLHIWLFWFFFADSICLGWIGQEIVESPFIEMGIFVTLCYFLYFIPMLPIAGFLENTIINNELKQFSINLLTTKDIFDKMDEITITQAVKDILKLDISHIEKNQLLTKYWREQGNLTENGSVVYNPTQLEELMANGHWGLSKKDIGSKFNSLFETNGDIRIHSDLLEKSTFMNDLKLNIYLHWFDYFQIFFIAFFLLSISLFFTKTGNFTRFINKLGFGYLIFELWRFSFDIVVRLSPLWFNFWTTNKDYNLLKMLVEEDSLFSKLFFIYALLIVSIFLYGIADRFFIANSYEIEFPILIFFIHIGTLFLFSVHTFIEFVIAIEIVTLATYTLTAFDRKNRFSTFAGVQYFILGSIPSGILILGVALLYKSWGTMAFENLDILLTDSIKVNTIFQPEHNDDLLGLFYLNWDELTQLPNGGFFNHHPRSMDEYWKSKGIFNTEYFPQLYDLNIVDEIYLQSNPQIFSIYLIIFFLFFNFLFKITAAPFHFWAPSIYGNSPVASVTFLSIFSKAMIFFVIVKLYFTIFSAFYFIFIPFLIISSVLSVLFGMIGAFSEKWIKRFFVYSSMGHVGFMLVALSLTTYEGISATFHYLPIYIITSFIMWFILLHLGKETNQIIHFKALKNSDPLLALIFSLIIFSMSGIPPLGGFFVKLDVLSALLDSSKFYTNYLLLFFTVASFFYYLRIVKIIFFDEDDTYIISPNIESSSRLWLISFLFIILLFYLFIIQKPILIIQTEVFATLF